MEKKENTLPRELLEILACPLCKGDVEYDPQREILICKTCKVYYEIIDGIPDMIPENGKPLEVNGNKQIV